MEDVPWHLFGDTTVAPTPKVQQSLSSNSRILVMLESRHLIEYFVQESEPI